MNMIDILIVAGVLIFIIYAAFILYKDVKSGNTCGKCNGCCSSCKKCSEEDDKEN